LSYRGAPWRLDLYLYRNKEKGPAWKPALG
jgi:hypothetical protein